MGVIRICSLSLWDLLSIAAFLGTWVNPIESPNRSPTPTEEPKLVVAVNRPVKKLRILREFPRFSEKAEPLGSPHRDCFRQLDRFVSSESSGNSVELELAIDEQSHRLVGSGLHHQDVTDRERLQMVP